MTEIKFCGLTSLEDSIGAVEAGAGWLGFNFYPLSPRNVSPQSCREIVSKLNEVLGEQFRSIRLVGVFVNAEPEEILRTIDECGLHLVQLSGNEPDETIRFCGERVYKAIRPAVGISLVEKVRLLSGRLSPPAALVDAAVPGQYGGTGHLADWTQAQSLAVQFPIFLAGGLTADNVADAVKFVQPWGVDTASGIESSPGKKDPGKMKAFVQAVREAACTKEQQI